MEDVPPSYESAVDRDAWSIIAPWIPSGDLCSASLVSRKWHRIFAPFLWGDPASHFGIENDAVYVALTRFKRTLKRARLSVRQLTHTLHLPPALSEIYGGPNAFWLRDVLEYLPSLQSLLVSKLPFFDHQSLLALRHRSAGPPSAESDEHIKYGLRLLVAKREPNTTSIGLVEALSHFLQLVYLDLSYTSPARDASILLALSNLPDLQVLKVRGTGLRDGEVEVLANAIGIRVRLLDVRDNLLTDIAVKSLLQACFLPSDVAQAQRASASNGRSEDWPVGMPPGPDFLSLDSLRSADLDQQLLNQLTRPLTGRLAFEDIPHKGLTHLYISDNHLSVEGIASLLESRRLHVLDGGSVDPSKAFSRIRSVSSPSKQVDRISYLGAGKLAPLLATEAGRNLTYLRVNHAVVTTRSCATDNPSRPEPAIKPVAAELSSEQSRFELPASSHAPVEMPPTAEPIFELSAEAPAQRAELPGDLIHFAVSSSIGTPKKHEEDTADGPIRGDGAFAPEVADIEHSSAGLEVTNSNPEEEVVLDARGSGLSKRRSAQSKHIPLSTAAPSYTNEQRSPPSPSPSILRSERIQSLLQKRPFAVPLGPRPSSPSSESNTSTNDLQQLHPFHLPHLQTLVLTDVPTHVPASSSVVQLLTDFISACAEESLLSHLLAQTDYSLPPGRSRTASELRQARRLFALTTLILEMAPPRSAVKSAQQINSGSKWHHSRQRMSWSKSSTEDRDSENLWTAAANDFSFFGEEGEAEDENGIYKNDPSKYGFLGIDGLIPAGDEEVDTDTTSSVSLSQPLSDPNRGRGSVMPKELPASRRLTRELPGSEHHTISSLPNKSTISAREAEGVKIATQEDGNLEEEPSVDVVAQLSAFRKAKRAEFEAAMADWKAQQHHRHRSSASTRGPSTSRPESVSADQGTSTSSQTGLFEVSPTSIADLPFVPGYWKGDVKVIRSESLPIAPILTPSRIADPHHVQRTRTRDATASELPFRNQLSPGPTSSPFPIPQPYSPRAPSNVPFSPTLVSPVAHSTPTSYEPNRLESLRRHESTASSSSSGSGIVSPMSGLGALDERDREVEEADEMVDFYGNRFERGYLYP